MAVQYHTARFRLVSHLAKALSVPTPAVRNPGSAGPNCPGPRAPAPHRSGHVRLGYARASTARQSLDAQTRLPRRGRGDPRLLGEDLRPRHVSAPNWRPASKLAGEIRASGAAVTLVVHEHKRLGRGIELAMLAEELKASDVGLEFLTGELQGSHDPSGVVFTVLAAMSGMEREYIRDRTLEGHESARGAARPSAARPSPTTAMLSMALHLRGQEMSLRDIADGSSSPPARRRASTRHPPP